MYTCAADQESTMLPTLKGAAGVVGKLPAANVHQLVHHNICGDEDDESNSLFDPTGDDTYDDLLNLPYLHDSTLLEQVRKRYFANLIYTRIGPIILALNPYDYTLKNYVDANMPKYFAEGRQVVAAAGKSNNLPHAWTTAHYAYWLLGVEGENQSVIVSGESGAGKTETAKIVVKYLGNVSTSQCSDSEREQATVVTHRVNATSPILEAFGNAKTVRNDNSSRFGKFMRVHFNPTTSTHPDAGPLMVGVSVVVYLLEKSRIVTHSTGERGYHSFYQLLAKGKSGEDAEKEAMLATLKLGSATEYENLNVGKATVIPGVDDVADFNEVCTSMESIGLQADERSEVWAVIGAVLHLLSIKFSALNVDECEIEGAVSVTEPGSDPASASPRRRAVSMSPARDAPSEERARSNSAHLGSVQTLLGLSNMSGFVDELTTTATVMRNEKIVKRLKKATAVDVRDAICKYLYESLFLWLVGKINDLVAPPPEAKDTWIALLDIFGFENFEHGNSFEQLCINLANETLQNHYNSVIFTRDMAECHAEGINTASVTFYDNQPCVDLICGVNFAMCGTQELQQSGKSIVTTPLSIMSLLDEECALGNGTDEAFCQKAISTFEKLPNFDYPKTQRGAFVVRHYAGDVKYTIEGFRLKNKNTTKDSLRDMLRDSSKAFVGNLVVHADELQVIAAEEAAASGVAGKKGGATVSSFFKTQLVRLMSEINRTHPHWIRCVKPHSAKKPRMFHGLEVMTQMCSAGVLETVKIRQQGFSIRIPLKQFVTGAGRLLLRKLPQHTAALLKRHADVLHAKAEALHKDIRGLTEKKLTAHTIAAKTAELQKQIADTQGEADALVVFAGSVAKGTNVPQSDNVADQCKQVFESSSINHDSLAQVGSTKVFLRSDGFRMLNSRSASVKSIVAASIVAMAKGFGSSSKVRCLQINEGFRRIQAALVARQSQIAMRLKEKAHRERELITKFRALLMLEAEEVKVRQATVDAEERHAFTKILSSASASFEAAQAAFRARMALVFEDQRREAEAVESRCRLAVEESEVSDRALLRELAVIFSDEESQRHAIEEAERQARGQNLEVLGLDELRAAIAAILLRDLCAALASVEASESAARTFLYSDAFDRFYAPLRLFLVLHLQEDAARKQMQVDEEAMFGDVLDQHAAEWEDVYELWLEMKLLADEEALGAIEEEEYVTRQGVEHEWEQRLILFHIRAGESFERCRKIQEARDRAELLRQMEEERVQQEAAERAYQQWVTEQREIAQAVWTAAVQLKKAKAEEEAERRSRVTEWQERALRERERIRKMQQREIAGSTGLGARDKLHATFMRGDPLVLERSRELEKSKRVEALRKARHEASLSQSPQRGTLNSLNATTLTTTRGGAASPSLGRTLVNAAATTTSNRAPLDHADLGGTRLDQTSRSHLTNVNDARPTPNLDFEAANEKFSRLMGQLDEISQAALTPRTKRGILLKVVRADPQWAGQPTTSEGLDDTHHTEDGGPQFVSVEEEYEEIAQTRSGAASPNPVRPKATPEGYQPTEAELMFDRGASPLGRFSVKQRGQQQVTALASTARSMSHTTSGNAEAPDLFAAATTRRSQAANTLRSTIRASLSSTRRVMNPFLDGWVPVDGGSRAYLPDGTLIDL